MKQQSKVFISFLRTSTSLGEISLFISTKWFRDQSNYGFSYLMIYHFVLLMKSHLDLKEKTILDWSLNADDLMVTYESLIVKKILFSKVYLCICYLYFLLTVFISFYNPLLSRIE